MAAALIGLAIPSPRCARASDGSPAIVVGQAEAQAGSASPFEPGVRMRRLTGSVHTAVARPVEGHAFVVDQVFGAPGDSGRAPSGSTLRLFEDGKELGPKHAKRQEIVALGGGRFLHQETDNRQSLYFSASDSSDPRSNGRRYTFEAYVQEPGGSGRTFYVAPDGQDRNPGTGELPWRSLRHAANTLRAGDTAIVRSGGYEEPTILFANSGTSASPISLRAETRGSAVIASTSGCNPAFYIARSYIVIEGFRMEVSPRNVACTVESSDNAAVRCYDNGFPSAAQSSSGWVGCVIRGLTVEASTQRGSGIKTNQDFSLIEENVVHSSIEAFNNSSTVIRNNYVDTGNVWGARLSGKGGVRGLRVYNNVVRTEPLRPGITVGGSSSCCWFDMATHVEAYRSAAFNNVVIVDGGLGWSPSLGMQGASDSALVNNVSVGGHLFLSLGSTEGMAPLPGNLNPVIYNNIFDCRGGIGRGVWYPEGGVLMRSNLFQSCRAPVQAGTSPVVGSQHFVDPERDWHLRPGGPAVGRGAEIILYDQEGKSLGVEYTKDGTRRRSPFDLGIH